MFNGLDVPTKTGRLLLAHGGNFGPKTFLPPPITHMGTSSSWTQVHHVQVRRFKAPSYSCSFFLYSRWLEIMNWSQIEKYELKRFLGVFKCIYNKTYTQGAE